MDDFVFKELLATKWKAEDFRDDFDQHLVKCLEDLVTCFTSDTSLAGVPETLHSPIPSAKRPKISLHSKKCLNSPHNLSNHVLTPTVDISQKTSLRSVKRATTVCTASPVPVTQAPNDQSKVPANATTSISLEAPKLRKSSTLSQPMDVDVVVSQNSSQNPVEPASLTPNRSTITSSQKSPMSPASDQPHKNSIPPSAIQECTVQALQQPPVAGAEDAVTSRPPSVDTVPRSLSRSAIVEKRVFQSAERLGGASRLASLGKTPSTLNTSVHKSRLNRSVGASSQKLTDRSALVLAAREQHLAEKQRNLLARIKEDEERLKAAQETRKAQRDAIKRANEDRRQAAKMRALLVDNKLHLYKEKEKPKIEQERIKEATVKPAPVTNEDDKENEATAAAPAVKTAEVRIYQSSTTTASTTTSVRPVGTAYATKTPAGNVPRPLLSQTTGGAGARVPLQRLVQTHAKAVPANLYVAKPVVANTATKPASTSQHLSTANGQKPSATVAPSAPTVVDTSVVVETSFDVSKLNSDSESDDDQPKRKVPGWCRRGNPELINTLNDIYNGKVRWQDEFLPASQIPFDIAEVFRGYAYRCRPRTSSGVWKTAPSQGTYGPYADGVAI